ncbi:MAG: hypothetical protein J6J23_07140 [Clostridia bacterium]|nr:hypothetical protein [Clostridia bacterium]
MKPNYLQPYNTSNKSYYKKAQVHYDNNTNTFSLQSYSTIVATYNDTTKTLTKCWNGYSRTTMKHIIDFVRQYTNIPTSTTLNKKWWDNLTPNNTTQEKYKVIANHAFGHTYTPTTTFDNYDTAQEFADTLNARSNGLWYYYVEEIE